MAANSQAIDFPHKKAKKAISLEEFLNDVAARNPGEPEFLQAVHEVATDILPFVADKPVYRDLRILERVAEPDRIISTSP